MLTGHFLNFFVRLFLSEQFRERDRGVSKVLSIATESYFYTWVRSLTRVTISLRALLEIHEKNHFMTSFTIFREERWKWCLTRLKYNYIDRERKKEKRAKQHTKIIDYRPRRGKEIMIETDWSTESLSTMSIRLEIDHSRQESGKEKRQQQLDGWLKGETAQCKFFSFFFTPSNLVLVF